MLTICSETRLRSTDRLLCNLWALDAEADARNLGYEFPPAEADAINDALAAVSRLELMSEEVPEVEEEVLVYEWDEEQNEECEDALIC